MLGQHCRWCFVSGPLVCTVVPSCWCSTALYSCLRCCPTASSRHSAADHHANHLHSTPQTREQLSDEELEAMLKELATYREFE